MSITILTVILIYCLFGVVVIHRPLIQLKIPSLGLFISLLHLLIQPASIEPMHRMCMRCFIQNPGHIIIRLEIIIGIDIHPTNILRGSVYPVTGIDGDSCIIKPAGIAEYSDPTDPMSVSQPTRTKNTISHLRK